MMGIDLNSLGPSARAQAASQLLDGPVTRKRRAHPEQDLQISVVNTILAPLEDTGLLTYCAIPNGYKRSKAEAGIAKAMGQRKGAWDIMIYKRNGQCFGLELKAGAGKQSSSQIDFASRMMRFGSNTYTCRNSADVMAALIWEGIALRTIAGYARATIPASDCLRAG